MLTIAQTVAGSWVITIPNPEERGWSTQLAEFSTDVTSEGSPQHAAMELSAALTVVALEAANGESEGILVSSHRTEDRVRMRALIEVNCDDNVCIEER